MQYIQYFQRLRQARKSSTQRHAQFLRNITGATHRHTLGQLQVETHLSLSLRPTVLVPVVTPTVHTEERHTDKYSLSELALTDLLDTSIRRYKRAHGHLPMRISLSRSNIYLLMLQDILAFYRNDYGEFKLLTDDSLDNDAILCS